VAYFFREFLSEVKGISFWNKGEAFFLFDAIVDAYKLPKRIETKFFSKLYERIFEDPIVKKKISRLPD